VLFVRSLLGNGKHAGSCVPMSVILTDTQENNMSVPYVSPPLLSSVCWVFVFVLSEPQDQATGITNIRTYRGANYDSDCVT
jgi:hypothetical protein